jgi:predicted dehydrogenase
MQKIRWGIIGCGDVAEKKSGPAFYKTDDSELIAVMRRDSDKARDYAERHNVPKWYDQADALIADTDVDAVYIATPPDSHADYTAQVAHAGKPVYVEKPMARNHSECQHMVDACQAAKVPLFVAYYRRALPGFLKVKSLVEDGAIGAVRFVSITLCNPATEDPNNPPWRVRPEVSGGGHFFDLASHQFDYLDYLLGPIASASGHARNQAGLYAAEDAVASSFAFESGVLGNGTWSFAADRRQDRIELNGDKGHIAFSTFDFTPIELTTATGTKAFDYPAPEHVQQPLIQTIVNALLNRGECPSTGASAARTSRIMDLIVHANVA